jgi:4-hydroxybenzoate polyprenyltransferase
VQDVLADREGGISSIATVIGARATVRVALAAYIIAALLLLGLSQPYSWAAAAAIPYLIILAPYWNITDATCARANSGWKKFIWLNFIAGAVVTLLVI